MANKVDRHISPAFIYRVNKEIRRLENQQAENITQINVETIIQLNSTKKKKIFLNVCRMLIHLFRACTVRLHYPLNNPLI